MNTITRQELEALLDNPKLILLEALATDVGYTNVRVYRGGKADWESAGLALEK